MYWKITINSILAAVTVAACSSSSFDVSDGDATINTPPIDGGTGGDSQVSTKDAAEPNWDAFFADDPPPKYCGPDGKETTPAELPGGTPECPADKNREGCPCTKVDEQAPCWPGLRVNRDRGVCKDGVTVCKPVGELSYQWGPCEGYVLPTEGATRGPGACRCFSSGRWTIDNLSPCFITYQGTATGEETYAVSTFVNSDGVAQCPNLPQDALPPPSPEPGQSWSTNRLQVDCTGQFKLCYTIKAGDAKNPTAADCPLAQSCIDVWYETKDVEQTLPPLPSWTSTDAACVKKFLDEGGYGEMSVIGKSSECEAVDDGSGNAYVFLRVTYCPQICNEDPTREECKDCGNGASGSFN